MIVKMFKIRPTMHLFPKDPTLRRSWVSAMKREGFQPKKSSLVNSNTSNLEDKLVMKVLNEVDNNSIFPIISLCHAIDTCEGIDNHYLLLVQLVSRKYLRLRIKNILKDHHQTRSLGNGNALQRNRVLYHQ